MADAEKLRIANALIPIIIGLELKSAAKKKRNINIANALIPIIVGLSLSRQKAAVRIPPATSLLLLSALPSLGPLIVAKNTIPNTSRAYRFVKRGLSTVKNGIINVASSLATRVFGPKMKKPTAITEELRSAGGEWNLGGLSISEQIKALGNPSMARLNGLALPTKAVQPMPADNAIPVWVPKTVAAELDFDPACNVGGSAGPTCIPTTMSKHITAANERNRANRLSNSALWKYKLEDYRIAKEDSVKSDSQLLAYKAAYPKNYPFFIKDVSGNYPKIVNVLSPFHELERREAGEIAESNLKALAKIAPPEMIYTAEKKGKTEFDDVKFMSIALLESLAFCGMNQTLDDPDCSPLRILGEIREFHAVEKELKAHLQTEESKRLTGPWGPIQRMLNLMTTYIGSKGTASSGPSSGGPSSGGPSSSVASSSGPSSMASSIASSSSPSSRLASTGASSIASTSASSSVASSSVASSSVASSSVASSSAPTKIVPPLNATAYYIPPIPFSIPPSLSKSLATPIRFSVPAPFGYTNSLRLFR